MKILVYSLNYHPDLTGIGKYTGEMAEWLALKGHTVRVVTAPPYYPEWRLLKGYSSISYRKEFDTGVTVYRCPLWVPRQLSGLKRILHLASFAVSSLPVMFYQSFWRPDVVLVVEPPLFCSPIALIVSWLSRASSWLHIQDFEVDAAFELGILSSVRLRELALKIESLLMSRFDQVSTISEKMLFKLDGKGVKKTKQILFPNWVDVEQIYPLESVSPFRKVLNIPESCVVFLYAGNMGEKQGLDIVIDAARYLIGQKEIRFVICGQGGSYKHLRQISHGLNNIDWLPLQPLLELNNLLNLADVHLLPQKAGAADLVLPSKLTGMMASGKPIIATADVGTQIDQVVNGAGVVVPPEKVDAFVSAIMNLAADRELRVKFGKMARAYAVNYLGSEVVLTSFAKSLAKIAYKR